MRHLVVLAALSVAACYDPDLSRDEGQDASNPVPDASSAECGPECGGTCVAGVCEITCDSSACDERVECPADVPCRVLCVGAGSCAGGVRCHGHAPCEILCEGQGSCANELRCDKGACTVQCTGDDSCRNTIKCHDACSCDVSCTGTGACDGASECPEAMCDTGLGCASASPGCDAC